MLGPGIPNPMLFGGGDPLDEFGKIARSVRQRRAANGYWSRTFGAPTNNKKFTISAWVKKCSILGGLLDLALISSGDNSTIGVSGTGAFGATYDNRLFVRNSATQRDYWAPLLRDIGSHYHFCVRIDTDNATQANRAIAEINGVVVAKGTSALSLSEAMAINSATVHYIGSMGGLSSYCSDNYFSHWGFVDGQALPGSTFAALNQRTGQWRPKSTAAIRSAVAVGGGPRNGWGANGCFLPFDDITSLTTLGYDRSQSDTDTTGNNWTATNISLTAGASYDSTRDTPTNVFCTWNPLDNRGTAPVNGNVEWNEFSGSNGHRCIGASFGATVGKAYLEFQVSQLATPASNFGYIGVLPAATALPAVGTSLPGAGTGGVALSVTGSSNVANQGLWLNDAKVGVGYDTTFALNDVVRVAIDFSAGLIWFGKNNAWLTGNPETGVGGYALPASPSGWRFAASVFRDTAFSNPGFRINAGQQPYAYSQPAGFSPLCTKDLPIRPAGPMKSTTAFVAVTDTGANIVSALVAAAPWSNWIRIIKRRDASEGWRLIFSDDPTNYLDTSTTSAKAALPAFGGTSYVGYSLNVSAANGVATGTFVHTTGVASVISDGLSTARKMIILHRESAGGGAWPTYHPDLTGGKLLYLNTTAGETVDASIGNVTASGFTAASTLPSGTYRWISLAETGGFISLGSYIANSSADGPFVNAMLSPALSLQKSTSGSATRLKDSARTPTNVAQIAFDLDLPNAEDSNANSIDNVSNGLKERAADAMNVAPQKYITLLVAAFPFRYANAR